MYRRTSQTYAGVGRSGGAGGDAHKMSGMKGGENWSKLCSSGGRVSVLALILEGEM